MAVPVVFPSLSDLAVPVAAAWRESWDTGSRVIRRGCCGWLLDPVKSCELPVVVEAATIVVMSCEGRISKTRDHLGGLLARECYAAVTYLYGQVVGCNEYLAAAVRPRVEMSETLLSPAGTRRDRRWPGWQRH
jgi:hypothetical protein